MLEIERRWLVDPCHLLDVIQGVPIDIEQGYICSAMSSVTATGITMRIRRRNGRPGLTIKQGVGLARTEVKLKITDTEFDELSELVYGWIVKTRYCHPIDMGLTAEVDVFRGSHRGLTIAEVEFPSVDLANAYVPPYWFGEEVTNNPAYSNAVLAMA